MKKLTFVVLGMGLTLNAFGDPIGLRLRGKFTQESPKNKSSHYWRNMVYVEPGGTIVANYTKRKNCSEDECVIEELKTEISPEELVDGSLKIKVLFQRKWNNDLSEVEGVVLTLPDEESEINLQNDGDGHQNYKLSIKPFNATS